MADYYNNSGARRSNVPGLTGVGRGNRFRIDGATPGSAQDLHNKLTANMNQGALKALAPHVTNDDWGNSVVRMFNPGKTYGGEERTYVDFAAGVGGSIFGHNAENPGSVFGITGMANVKTGTVHDNINTLSSILNNAGNTGTSIPKALQTFAMPNLDVNSMTSQQARKWGSSYLAVTDVGVGAGGVKYPVKAEGREIRGFSAPGFDSMYTGSGSHIRNANQYLPSSYPQAPNGDFFWEKFKRDKNRNVSNNPYERTVGIPALPTSLAMRMPGQESPDNVYANRMGFAMFAGGGMGEGTQYVREGSGYLPTDTFHKIKLNTEQTNQFNKINSMNLPQSQRNEMMGNLIGFAQGDLFMHRDTPIGAIAAGVNIRAGIFGSIPGLNKRAGSADFSMIRDMSLNGDTLGVTLAQYTGADVATSKFGKKSQNQPVGMNATNSPLNVRNANGEQFNWHGVQAMPSPEGAALIGVNSLLTSNTTDELSRKFSDFAMSNFRLSGGNLIDSTHSDFANSEPMSSGAARRIWAGGAGGSPGTMTGRAGQIMTAMGAQHFNSSMQVGFSTDQVTQEQYDTLNKSFNFQGQSYSRFSNPRDLGKGWLEVDKADIYSDLVVGERFQKSYVTGRSTYKGAIMDNMAYAHEENYKSLLAINRVQGGNSALRFRQVMESNVNPNVASRMKRKAVNVEDLNASEILGGIPLDHEDRQGEFMRQLARGPNGNNPVRMGGKLMPSPREALQRVTADKTGKVVGTFGASYFNAIQANVNLSDTRITGGDEEGAERHYNAQVERAYGQAMDLANSPSVIKESNSVTQRNTLGGPVGSMPLLQANEVLMDKSTMYNMMGVNDLPGDMQDRARASIDHYRETMPDYFTARHTMHPVVKPDSALANLSIVTPEEYMQRPGAQELPDMRGGKYFLSQALAQFHGKDFDGDQGDLGANGAVFNKNGRVTFTQNNVAPTTVQRIKEIQDLQFAERDTLRESMEFEPDSYQRSVADAARPGGSGWKSQAAIMEGTRGVQDSKASIGQIYNMGIGMLVGGARQQGDREGAAAAGWIAQLGYQTATKEQKFNDPGFNRISEIIHSGNYDWGKGDRPSGGYKHRLEDGSEEFVSFQRDLGSQAAYSPATADSDASRRYGGGYGAFAMHIAENYAQMGSSAGAEEYAAKVAPNLATMMLPRNMRDNTEAHTSMKNALISAQASGDWKDIGQTYSGIVGGADNVLRSVFGKNTDENSSMAIVGAATLAKTYAKNEPAAMSRIGNSAPLRALAGVASRARAGIDIKKADKGFAAHEALADSLESSPSNRHTNAINRALQGSPSERSVVQQVSVKPPDSVVLPTAAAAEKPAVRPPISVGQQSRLEYLAGKGGVYKGRSNKSLQSMGFFGSPAEAGMSNDEAFGYDPQAIMERTLVGARELVPELSNVPVVLGSKTPKYQYNADTQKGMIMMPSPEDMHSFVVGQLGKPSQLRRLSAMAGIHPDDMTPDIATAAIMSHELGHALVMQGHIDAGTTEDYIAGHNRDIAAVGRGDIKYGDIGQEQDADAVGGEVLRKLAYDGHDLGLDRSNSTRMDNTPFSDLRTAARQISMGFDRQGARNGRRVVGMKMPYNQESTMHEPGRSGEPHPNSTEGATLTAARKREARSRSIRAEFQGAPSGSMSRGDALESSSDRQAAPVDPGTRVDHQTVFNIANQTVKEFSPKFQGVDATNVEELSHFVSSGGMEKLESYQELLGHVGMDELSNSQIKEYRKLTSSYNKSLNAVDRYGKEVQMVSASGGKQRLGTNALGVEGILARDDGRVGAAFDRKNADEIRASSNEAKEVWDSRQPGKHSVNGQSLAKGMAGVDGIEKVSGSLNELAASLKDVNTVTKEQYKSMQQLTKQYDAAEAVIAKLTKLDASGEAMTDDQRDALAKAKSVVGGNRDALDAVRSTYAAAASGSIAVAPEAMAGETRQQLLMEALNRGGIGGARARSRAKDQGLYGRLGDPDDDGGLDFLGRNFQSEGSINAIGGMMRLGNRAGSLLHGMTHLSHNIINPLAAEVSQYGQMQLDRSRMMYGITGEMTGEGNRVLQRQGNLNLARQSASRQVYNTYAGVADAFGGQNIGMLQGIAQSVASPALSAAVGMQAMGLGQYGGVAALGVGAVAGLSWLSGAAGDKNQLAQSNRETMANGGRVTNAANTLVAATGMLFNPQGTKDAAGIVGSMQDFESFTRGYTEVAGLSGIDAIGIPQGDPRRNAVRTDSKYSDMSIPEMIAEEGKYQREQGNNLTDAEIGTSFFQSYTEGIGRGLSEEQQQSIFSFSSMYGGKTNEMLRSLNAGAMAGRTGMQNSIAAQVAVTGGSMFNPNAVTAGLINDTFGIVNWVGKGRSQGTYDAFVAENAPWAQQANLLNRQAGGPGSYSPTIMADDDRYVDNPFKRDLDLQARQSSVNGAMTNTVAFRGGYSASVAAKRQSFVDNYDTVGLATFSENEQTGLSWDRQIRAMGGKSLSIGQLGGISNFNQTEGDVLKNVLGNDPWTISKMAKSLGNVGLATIDTKTGLGATDYGISAGQFAAFQKSDKLGLLNGVTASQVAGGTMGIQRDMELAQRGFQMFQFQQGQQQRTLQSSYMTGGGATLNGQGFAVGGGGLGAMANVFAQNGMKFNAGNGMGQWQLEDAGTLLNRQQQLFSQGQQGKQLDMSFQQFAVSGRQWQEGRNLQVAQFDYNTQFNRNEMNINRGQQVTSRGWQAADMQYSRNMSELQFGFQMRDADRNIRYSRGRDRLDQMRSRDDAVILHAAEMGQKDKEEDRFKEQNKWADDKFNRDKDHFEKTTDFQRQQMALDKKHFEENRVFQKQSLDMQRDAFNKSVGWMKEEWKLEDQRRLIDRQVAVLQINMANEAALRQQQLTIKMQQSQDILNGIGNSQHVILAQFSADLKNGTINVDNLSKAIRNLAAAAGGGVTTSNPPVQHVNGGGASTGGYIREFMTGGYTGLGDRHAVRGVVHGGEYVIPQEGTPVIHGDNQESLKVLKMIASILERIEKNPAVVNAVINTSQNQVKMSSLNLTDLAHGSL